MAVHNSSSSQPTAEAPALSRRAMGTAFLGAAVALTLPAGSAQANLPEVTFKKDLKKRKIPEEDYVELPANGLRVYDLNEGSGPAIKAGDRIIVHFDCMYRGLDVVSSRSSRLLGGNRTISEPYEFIVGEPVYAASIPNFGENANGMYAGGSGPKPPQALSLSAVGMKRGGRRSILVDKAELGYPKGVNELPAGEKFELKIEVLSIASSK
ncbi:hypothetical protein HYH03_016289 [Edaphochlamys debaryana]|uniref:Uncharacterized protein n=1 Tax=Edaphochlamys debaryana TaxID=47281 RepID=A0A836BRR2_9CHLO|nr:hypothetical protein HYH03_016289 [Edaphochlamys debaryana]|eukprot:KAG2484903.1 hypothetical protein HYH03_016289 [Edaphochlamys debaryana]